MDYQIEKESVENLELDWQNPRLAEFGIKKKTSPTEIFSVLWKNMALEELVTSIVAHGFFDTEPLIIIKEKGKSVVLEGNRRLAAVMIVRNPELVNYKLDPAVLDKITPQLVKRLDTLPVIDVKKRQNAWRFIGFKHINGPTGWNSFAKAQHIAQVYREYGISLDEIAFQVGDTHKTVQKLFQGLMVIEQAERLKIFNRDDIKKKRLYFSHLYTALQYEGFKKYLSIDETDVENESPVPAKNKDRLKELLLWLYGSKKQSIEPVIESQNPDLKNLESVVQNREAVAALKSGSSLSAAFEISRPKNSVFEESLFGAKREIQKAWSFVNEGYNGNSELLKTAGAIADLADELYSTMAEKSNKNTRMRKKRVTEE